MRYTVYMNETFFNIFRIKELRNKILFILGLLVIYRLAANIPLPGVDVLALKRLFEENAFLGLLNIFSGGGLSNISIVLLGVAPYITASITHCAAGRTAVLQYAFLASFAEYSGRNFSV